MTECERISWPGIHLEAVSKPVFQLGPTIGAEYGSGQLMKGLEVRSASFVAQLQSPEVAEPTERALDDVARLAKTAAVGTRSSKRRQDRFDPSQLTRSARAAEPYPASPCKALGLERDRPLGPAMDGMLINSGSATWSSRVLAGVVLITRGMPAASVSTWRLQPAFARSVGFGPVCAPQKPREHSRCRARLVRG